MFNGALTLGQLRDLVAEWIELIGENARIGGRVEASIEGGDPAELFECVDQSGLMLSWVYVDDYGRIVGTEGDDYKPAKGETAAIVVD